MKRNEKKLAQNLRPPVLIIIFSGKKERKEDTPAK